MPCGGTTNSFDNLVLATSLANYLNANTSRSVTQRSNIHVINFATPKITKYVLIIKALRGCCKKVRKTGNLSKKRVCCVYGSTIPGHCQNRNCHRGIKNRIKYPFLDYLSCLVSFYCNAGSMSVITAPVQCRLVRPGRSFLPLPLCCCI